MTNEELAALAKRGDLSAKEQLFSNNQNYTHYLAMKFCSQKDDQYEDIVSIANLGMLKAYNAYNPEKGYKFITFAALCMKNEILLSLRSLRKNRGNTNLEDSIFTDTDGNSRTLADIKSDGKDFTKEFENASEAETVYELIEKLSPLYRTIAIEHLINDRTQDEVALMVGVGRSYVQKISKRIQHMFRNHRDKGVFTMKGTEFK